uniref:Membrane protein n=1 Tax=uncultured organism TaxID=155900 RepID=M1P1V5_9ZZZZ|nr:membrane protein [uncultured organism]
MSDLIKHVLIGEVLGESLSSSKFSFLNNEFTAFSTGLSSQIIMDYIDNEFVVNWFNFQQFTPEVIFYIFFQAVITFLIIKNILDYRKKDYHKFKLKVYSISGAVLPDVIDGIYSIFKPGAWYNGNLIFFWHRSKELLPVQTIGATLAISFSLFFFRFYIYPFLLNFKFVNKYFSN